MSKQTQKPRVEINRTGWWALRHKRERWWIGNEEGTICYKDFDLARAANTIACERSPEKGYPYEIARFEGANVHAGDFTPEKTAREAITNIMGYDDGSWDEKDKES